MSIGRSAYLGKRHADDRPMWIFNSPMWIFLKKINLSYVALDLGGSNGLDLNGHT